MIIAALVKERITMAKKEYINREDVLGIIDYLRTKYVCNYNKRNKYNQFWSDTIRYIEKKVNSLPSANVEPIRHGHWILTKRTKLVPTDKIGLKENFTTCRNGTLVDENNINKKQ